MSYRPDRNLKLLVIEPDPSFGGGSEAVMLSLARGLAARGHEVTLLHEREGSMLEDYRAFCTRMVRAPLPGFSFRAPVRTLACVLRIGRLARQLRSDVIVSSHLGFLRHAALIRLASGMPGCFHLGLSLDHAPASLRLALPRIAAGVAPSAHTMETWRAGGWDLAALHQVDNWVDGSRFQPAPDLQRLREEIGMAGNGAHVVYVGRVCRQKGVDMLVSAFPKVLERCPDATLHIVGPVAADFQARLGDLLAQLGGPTRERIVLRPATATPEKFYAAADLVCAPSTGDEAFGLAVLEAMACGVPVVATDIGVIATILGSEQAGLLVAPDDSTALAERLSSWIERPADRHRVGAILRQRALREFGIERGVDRYESILRSLSATRAAGG